MNTTETSTAEPNTTASVPRENVRMGAALFNGIHGSALAVLALSILFSLGVLVYLLAWSQKKFYQRPIGERLVVYLALCDLIFSVSHCLDHGYMMATKRSPPDALCRVFATILVTFIYTQSIIVTFTAANCFYMVVKEKRFELGKYDWRLLLPALGIPLVLSISAAIPGLLGAGTMWCVISVTHKYGRIVSAFMVITLLAAMIANILLYGIVWGKLKKAGRATGKMGKYHSLAKTLTVFVAVYILQYFPAVFSNVWHLIELPPAICLLLTVIFTNLGGVFNFIAYTLLRRHAMRTQPANGIAAKNY